MINGSAAKKKLPASGVLVKHVLPERVMRVLIDGRKILDGGIGVHTENTIQALLAQDNVDVSVILDPEIRKAPEVARSSWLERVDVVKDAARPYSLDEAFCMPRRVDFSHYDVFHVPHFTLPFGIKIPTVITVHDLIHIKYPEHIYYPWVARILIKSALRRASRVLTVSQATYDDLVEFVGSNEKLRSKLRVVPNALDPFFLKNPQGSEYLLNRFKLQGDYLLTVFSTVKPHKGVSDLLAAFKALKDRQRLTAAATPEGQVINDLKLVLVGKGTETLVERERLLDIVGSIPGVYVFGAVSKEELLNLYARALGVVVPSKIEGFCLPVIESHAQGTPVVVRPVPAIRELVTERDIICGDLSGPALESGLMELIRRHCSGKVLRGWPNLRRYDRDDIGRTMMAVYAEAVGAGVR